MAGTLTRRGPAGGCDAMASSRSSQEIREVDGMAPYSIGKMMASANMGELPLPPTPAPTVASDDGARMMKETEQQFRHCSKCCSRVSINYHPILATNGGSTNSSLLRNGDITHHQSTNKKAENNKTKTPMKT